MNSGLFENVNAMAFCVLEIMNIFMKYSNKENAIRSFGMKWNNWRERKRETERAKKTEREARGERYREREIRKKLNKTSKFGWVCFTIDPTLWTIFPSAFSSL